MARAKQLRPVDHLTQSLLADAVRETGAKHADVGEKAGMSQNRVSIILRLGTPPATVGEISAIARAIGRSGSWLSPMVRRCCRFVLMCRRPRRSTRLRPALWVTALSGRWRRLAVSAKRMCSTKATNLRVTI